MGGQSHLRSQDSSTVLAVMTPCCTECGWRSPRPVQCGAVYVFRVLDVWMSAQQLSKHRRSRAPRLGTEESARKAGGCLGLGCFGSRMLLGLVDGVGSVLLLGTRNPRP